MIRITIAISHQSHARPSDEELGGGAGLCGGLGGFGRGGLGAVVGGEAQGGILSGRG